MDTLPFAGWLLTAGPPPGHFTHPQGHQPASVQEKEKAAAAPIQGENAWPDPRRSHAQTAVDYPMPPPAGGEHNPVWVGCDAKVYTDAAPEEKAVHSLEHGAAWVTYNDKASKAEVKTLREKVSTTPYSPLSLHSEQFRRSRSPPGGTSSR